jgi:microcystin-dependent protein
MEPFVGEIRLFPWNWAPRNWAVCNGVLLPIAQYSALFSLLGTMYGGNGVTNFALPDLRGRSPIHRSNVYSQGEMDGVEQVTLTIATMPAHQHAFLGTSGTANQKPPGGGTLATDTIATDNFYAADTNPLAISPASVGPAGGSQPHNNMQPYLVMNYCIAIQGIFPSRN